MTSFQRRVASQRPEHELIATFGDAELMRDMSGKLELKGGTAADREQARCWIETFLTGVIDLRAQAVRGCDRPVTRIELALAGPKVDSSG